MTYKTHKEQVGRLAAKQAGRITLEQLKRLGVTGSTVQGWEAQGYLRRTLPRVFAVGHCAPSRDADLWAAVLYAGPGAMLSHATAAHWRGLIDYAPRLIEVSTPRQKRSLPQVEVHGRRRELERDLHNGMPVTCVATTMIDLAATGGPRVVQRALGQLDFQRLLDVDALLAACGSGRAGAAALRAAIEVYDPRLKYANGPLEEAFLQLCRRQDLPLPILNAHVHGIKSDAYWPRQGLVVELDSELAHSSPAQRRRDRRNDLTLRGHGLSVIRYDWNLVHHHREEVCRDVVGALERLVAEPRRGATAN